MALGRYLPVFSAFRVKTPGTPSDQNVSIVRSDTRTLIRRANVVAAAALGTSWQGEDLTRGTGDMQAMAVAEAQLASSISAAVSPEFDIQAVVRGVIGPVLEDTIIVSEAAHDAVQRAVDLAGRG